MAVIQASKGELERDGIARTVSAFWIQFNRRRLSWIEESQDIRRYLSSESTQSNEVSKLGWKNNTTVPKLTQIYDNLKSYYMAALFPNDDWFVFDASNPTAMVKASIVEQYLKAKLKDSDFVKVIERMLGDWLIYGNCFGGVTWVDEKAIDLETGEEYSKYVGPKGYRVSPLDCMMDPRADTFEESVFMRRSLIYITQLEAMAEEHWDASAIQKVYGMRTASDSDYTDYYKQESLYIDDFDSYNEYLESNHVEIIEYHGDIYDEETQTVMTNREVIIADRMFVLSNRESPSWVYKKPYVTSGWRYLPDNLYAQSPLRQIVGMQYRCDHLENAKADAFDQIIHPIVKIMGDTVEDFQFRPGEQIRVGEGDIEFMRPDTTALAANNEIALYHSMMENFAGAPREAAGFRTPGEKTAFEVNVLQQGADRMFLDKVHQFEDQVIKPMLNMMFELAVRNLNVVDMIRVFDNEQQASVFVSISKEDITASGTITPIGAKHYAQRNRRVQELNNLIQIMQLPQFAPHFSAVNAGNLFEQELGLEKYNIFEPMAGLTEQMQVQAQMQLLQQTMMAQEEEGMVEEEQPVL